MRSKAGGVFYIAAEDESGMKGRVRALKDRHGDADDFRLLTGCSDLMSKDSPDLRALIDAVKDQRPSLIIIDTMTMAFQGLEENEAAAMGRVVTVARDLASFDWQSCVAGTERTHPLRCPLRPTAAGESSNAFAQQPRAIPSCAVARYLSSAATFSGHGRSTRN